MRSGETFGPPLGVDRSDVYSDLFSNCVSIGNCPAYAVRTIAWSTQQLQSTNAVKDGIDMGESRISISDLQMVICNLQYLVEVSADCSSTKTEYLRQLDIYEGRLEDAMGPGHH
jgi:hypothetical protein